MDKRDYLGQLMEFWEVAFQADTYAHPAYLWLLPIIPVLLLFLWFKGKKDRFVVRVSGLGATQNISRGINWKRYIANSFLVVTVASVVLVLAQPQTKLSWSEEKAEGIDIVLALDISSSMLAKDFKPDRLEASKKIAVDFLKTRPNDRFGLVVFAAESFTQCPLTIDHQRLAELFSEVKMGLLEDGTAVGEGLATAVDRLRKSKAKSKVIILLSDGESNRGDITPKMAGELAKSFGVRVYTIGVGKKGMLNMLVGHDFFGREVRRDVEVKIDEETLKAIADSTGGKYFRAVDNEALAEIYEIIDEMEKTEMASIKYSTKNELYLPLLLISVLFFMCYLLVEMVSSKKLIIN